MEELLYVDPSFEGSQESQDVLSTGEAEYLKAQF